MLDDAPLSVVADHREWASGVEGPDIDAGPLPGNGVRGALVALGDRGIPVIRSNDGDDSAWWLRSLAQSRVLGKRVQVVAPYRPRAGNRDPVPVAMLCAIPGISLRDARALIDRFRTIKALADLSTDDLRTVAGIGETKAAAVQTALTHVL